MTAPLDSARVKLLTDAFRMPSMQNVMSRKTSITNAFVCALIPVVRPSPQEIEEALCILGMDASDVRCAYCGDKATEWDHLRPLVVKRRLTGFISELANLVPSCPKCNQSKGNSDWRKWMLSRRERRSPTARGITDVAERMARLEAYERWREPTKVDFEGIVGRESLEQYWSLLDAVVHDMSECQEVASAMRAKIVATVEHT